MLGTQRLVSIALCAAPLLFGAPLVSCGSSVRTSVQGGAQGGTAVPANYPPTVLESADHAETMRAEWRRLFEAYAIPSDRRVVPDLKPFTHTPESTLGVGPIHLGKQGAAAPDEETIRLLLRAFISDRAQLLGVSAAKLSLEGVADAGPIGKRYSFAQSDYAFPIVAPDGRLEFIVSNAGDILQVSDSAIPVVDLPAEPRTTREAAAKRVLGSTFTYHDFAGQPRTVTVSDPSQIEVKRLVVYPQRTEAALRIRLAWEVVAGSSMTWTVFVDAITGETIDTRQNFQT